METVQQLRHMGYKVGVRYERTRILEPGLGRWKKPLDHVIIQSYSPSAHGFLREMADGSVLGDGQHGLYPRGGTCTVSVQAPDGCTFEGKSVCALADNFDRKRGLMIALGRALKLEEAKHAM